MQTKSFDYDANEKAVAVEAPRVHVLLSVLDSAVTSVEDCLMTLAMCVEPALSPQEECEVSEKRSKVVHTQLRRKAEFQSLSSMRFLVLMRFMKCFTTSQRVWRSNLKSEYTK